MFVSSSVAMCDKNNVKLPCLDKYTSVSILYSALTTIGCDASSTCATVDSAWMILILQLESSNPSLAITSLLWALLSTHSQVHSLTLELVDCWSTACTFMQYAKYLLGECSLWIRQLRFQVLSDHTLEVLKQGILPSPCNCADIIRKLMNTTHACIPPCVKNLVHE